MDGVGVKRQRRRRFHEELVNGILLKVSVVQNIILHYATLHRNAIMKILWKIAVCI